MAVVSEKSWMPDQSASNTFHGAGKIWLEIKLNQLLTAQSRTKLKGKTHDLKTSVRFFYEKYEHSKQHVAKTQTFVQFDLGSVEN